MIEVVVDGKIVIVDRWNCEMKKLAETNEKACHYCNSCEFSKEMQNCGGHYNPI